MKRKGNQLLRNYNKIRNIARIGYYGGQIAKKAYDYYSGSKQKTHEALPLTAQHDFSSQYRKRRRGRGRRFRRRVRRAKKFSRAVLKVEENLLGCHIFMRNATGTANFAAGASATFTLVNCVFHQTGARELDLYSLRNNLLANNASLRKTSRIMLQSCCLDVSITSRSSNTATMDLDVYVIVAKKNLPFNGLGNGVDSFATTETPLPNTNVGWIPVTDAGVATARTGTTVSTALIGWTPWLTPNFCSYFTVLSKKKILLTPGATTHLQIKKTYRRMISLEDCDKYDTMKGLTYGYLFNANSIYNGTNQPTGNIDFNWEQFYNVKMLKDSEDTVVNI